MPSKNKICIIDYKTGGNIFSVRNSLEHVGADCYLSSDASEIAAADKIFFPGVGSFAKAIDSLHKLGLSDTIVNKANSDTPFLSICVGMQVLFSYSTESPDKYTTGLSVLPAGVEKFNTDSKLKIPHMGWNIVNQDPANPLFQGIDQSSQFYFVHSYRVSTNSSQHSKAIKDAQESNLKTLKNKYPQSKVAITDYGEEYISHFWNGNNLFACQFHPEKSGEAGLQLLKNFVKL